MYAADCLPAPDDRAILAHIALLHFIAVDFSLADKLKFANIGREIVRIGNAVERLGKKFIGRVAENAAQGSVHPDPSAVGTYVCDSSCRVVERGPVPGLAVARQSKLDFLVGKTRLRFFPAG